MKLEQCKECGYLRYGEFCGKFSVPINDFQSNMRQPLFIPIICIPECKYAKEESCL